MNATVLKRNKALTVNPLKVAQPLGAAQAFLGIAGAMPMLHGSQGCTAFAKVMFVRHFREPIPLQTTAMEQVSTVMGADDNVIEGLKTICEKSHPAVIGVLSTGLSETQGTDLPRVVKQFRAAYPAYDDVHVVPVNTPDFAGCFETGYAAAVTALVEHLVPTAGEAGSEPGRRQRQVNVLAGPALTPGDIEAIKELLEAFDLRPLVLPDIADSLDGHLTDTDFSPLTVGGTAVPDAATMGDSAATLVIGPSLFAAAERLAARAGVPTFRFDSLLGLEAVDRFVSVVAEIAGRPVPPRIERQRAQLQDAMVDCHFVTGQARVALAAEPDALLGMTRFLQGMGAEVVAAVIPARGSALADLPLAEVKVGDLEDLERLARERQADLLVGNSHLGPVAERLSLPLVHFGFPQYDRFGGYQEEWVGYRGARRQLFALANRLSDQEQHAIEPYRSVYAQKPEYREGDNDDFRAPVTGRRA